jgi:hypothetical protein
VPFWGYFLKNEYTNQTVLTFQPKIRLRGLGESIILDQVSLRQRRSEPYLCAQDT